MRYSDRLYKVARRSPVFLGLFLIALVILAGCAKQQLATSYYLIEYAPSPVNPQLKLSEPIPYRVQVRNFKIPRSYDSVRIIARYSSHQIDYYRYSLWAVRPQVAVADLLVQHIKAYNLFRNCQREFLEERPDFEITGEVTQIERFESEAYTAAHLRMRFEFYDSGSNDILLLHEFDREISIPPGNMSIFAKAVSDLISQESEQFLVKIVTHFYPVPADSTNEG
ncbi:MAG: hypothetical protein FJY67_10455 [Calditrichaeota bacterium]|nr:hypothetical protein [Calditrichota bacterium]